MVALALALLPATVRPQAPGAQALTVIKGHVERPDSAKRIPVAGVMVTLHRVGTDSAGPVDSVRTDAAGRYSVSFRWNGTEAVYFAAATYRGIAYFSAPIQGVRTADEGEIVVFDTASRGITLHAQGHHLVVGAPHPDGARDIVEVWEISNDTAVTLIGTDSLSATWTAPVPKEATHLAGGQGDVAASSIVRRGERVAVLSPFGPGIKQISYTYTLPSGAFPLVVPVEQRTSVLEVLVEEQLATVKGASLQAIASASTAGRTFKRYQTQDAAAGQQFRVEVPTTSESTRKWLLIALASLFGIAMIYSFVRAVRRRAATMLVASERAVRPSEALLAEIAMLDTQFERGTPALERAQYDEQRTRLKAQLAAALAVEAGAD